MPQKRQAPRPDATRLDTYPSAPSEPKERLEWVRRRNAGIAKVDEEPYLAAIKDQQKRAREYVAPSPKGRQDR